jgi:hypothetical protein
MHRLEENFFPASVLLILGCLAAFTLAAGAQSADDISKAKHTLGTMGIAMEGQQSESRSGIAPAAVIKAPREGRVEDPKKALKYGIDFSQLADPRPTPVQPGTKVYFTIGDRGKVTFYLNEWNMMKNTSNQPTPVHINPGLLPPDIGVNYGSFPVRS